MYGADRPFVLKRAIAGLSYRHVCGTKADWAGSGSRTPPVAPTKYGPNGLPYCCGAQFLGGPVGIGGESAVNTAGPCYSTCFDAALALWAAGKSLYVTIPQCLSTPPAAWGLVLEMRVVGSITWEWNGVYEYLGIEGNWTLEVIAFADPNTGCWYVSIIVAGVYPGCGPGLPSDWGAAGAQDADTSIQVSCSSGLCLNFRPALAASYEYVYCPPGCSAVAWCISSNPLGTCGSGCSSGGSSGSGSGSGATGCGPGGSVVLDLEGPCATGSYTLNWDPLNNQFDWFNPDPPPGEASLGEAIFYCTSDTTGWLFVQIINPDGSGSSFIANLTGSVGPVDMVGSGSFEFSPCAGLYEVSITS